MTRRITPKITAALYLAVALVIGQVVAIQPAAGNDLKVAIGKSATFAKKAYSHDISIGDLKNGRSAYVVSSSAKESFQIELSEKQIKDILAGSTVVITTQEGDKKVKIGPKKKQSTDSGW